MKSRSCEQPPFEKRIKLAKRMADGWPARRSMEGTFGWLREKEIEALTAGGVLRRIEEAGSDDEAGDTQGTLSGKGHG